MFQAAMTPYEQRLTDELAHADGQLARTRALLDRLPDLCRVGYTGSELSRCAPRLIR